MKVAVVDYGAGNVFSVGMALKHVGASEVIVTADGHAIANSDYLILPGVGAFGAGMQKIRALHLQAVIAAFVASGRPVLGICLGMQMLATASQEFGEHEGLNLIPGQVQALPSPTSGSYKIPFVGWTEIHCNQGAAGTLLDTTREGDCVYLVHSYHFVPDDPCACLATTRYGDRDVVVAVRARNVLGLQFHPEKSGEVGLRMLERFISP